MCQVSALAVVTYKIRSSLSTDQSEHFIKDHSKHVTSLPKHPLQLPAPLLDHLLPATPAAKGTKRGLRTLQHHNKLLQHHNKLLKAIVSQLVGYLRLCIGQSSSPDCGSTHRLQVCAMCQSTHDTQDACTPEPCKLPTSEARPAQPLTLMKECSFPTLVMRRTLVTSALQLMERSLCD